MKIARHPTYGETTIMCACGATYPTRATVPQLRVAVCAACHPWWTGRQKRVETAGAREWRVINNLDRLDAILARG